MKTSEIYGLNTIIASLTIVINIIYQQFLLKIIERYRLGGTYLSTPT